MSRFEFARIGWLCLVVSWSAAGAASAQSQPVVVDSPAAVGLAASRSFSRVQHSTPGPTLRTEQLLGQAHLDIQGTMTIGELAASLAARGISLRLSENCDLTEDFAVDLQPLGPESLGYRLERALARRNCVYSIDAEGHIMVLSAAEEAETTLVVIYDVTQISAGLENAGALILLIESGVEPPAWDEENFAIRAYTLQGRRMLSVSASYPVQQKVRQYLNDLAAVGTLPSGQADSAVVVSGTAAAASSAASPVVLPNAASR